MNMLGLHCLLLLLFTVTIVHSGSQTCVRFEDNKTEFTVERGSSFNLTFYTSQSCRMNTVTVSNVTTTSRPSTFCTFNVSSSPCLIFGQPSHCFCDARTEQLRVYLNLAGVNGEKWKIHSGSNSEDVVTVRYYNPPKVLETAVAGSGNQTGIVQQGATVTLTCTWDPGRPPHNHAFLERRGLELKAEVVKEDNPMQIEHVINDAQCEDSGQVYCKVTGTTAHKSVLLLVLCPPTFHDVNTASFFVSRGGDLQAEFSMLDHTDKQNKWALFKVQQNNGDILSRAAIDISGTVPELIVSLTLKEVTSQDQGQWRLEVTNDVGTGYVEFQLILRLADDQDSSTNNGFFLLGAIGVVCLIVAISVVVVGIYIKNRGGFAASSPMQPEARAEPETMSMALRPSVVPSPPVPDVKFRSNSPSSLSGSQFEEAPYLEIIDDDDDHDHSMTGYSSPSFTPGSNLSHHTDHAYMSVPSPPPPSAAQSDKSDFSGTNGHDSDSDADLLDGYLHPTASAAEKTD